jgi:RNA-splicing ligase RtcB
MDDTQKEIQIVKENLVELSFQEKAIEALWKGKPKNESYYWQKRQVIEAMKRVAYRLEKLQNQFIEDRKAEISLDVL